MNRILTREELNNHIKSMATKNCVYALILKRLSTAKKEVVEEFWKKIAEQKFTSLVDFDIYLEK